MIVDTSVFTCRIGASISWSNLCQDVVIGSFSQRRFVVDIVEFGSERVRYISC